MSENILIGTGLSSLGFLENINKEKILLHMIKTLILVVMHIHLKSIIFIMMKELISVIQKIKNFLNTLTHLILKNLYN